MKFNINLCCKTDFNFLFTLTLQIMEVGLILVVMKTVLYTRIHPINQMLVIVSVGGDAFLSDKWKCPLRNVSLQKQYAM